MANKRLFATLAFLLVVIIVLSVIPVEGKIIRKNVNRANPAVYFPLPKILEKNGLAVPAEVICEPRTFNLDSNGNWITCSIELPAPYDSMTIDVNSVLLNGKIENERNLKYGFVKNQKQIMVKFSREKVQKWLIENGITKGNAVLEISGKFASGEFRGSDTIAITKEGPGPEPLAWISYSSNAIQLITDAKISNLDSDSDNDIVLGHGVYDSSPSTGRVSVWENNGNININTWARYYTTLANYVFSVAVGDINGDGRNDIVAGTAGSSNNLAVLENPGTNLNVNLWQKHLFTPTTANPASIKAVAIADLNKDGKNEIIAGGGAGSTVYVIDTKGVFDTAQWQVHAIEVPGLIYGLSVGDINNDNYDDIVAATGFAGVGSARGVFAAINPSGATLDISAWTTYNRPYAENVYSVAVGDIDRDGKNDIVIGSGVTYNRVAVLYNDGTLTGNINNWALYEKSVSGTMGGGVGAVAVGDIDGINGNDIVSGFLVLVQKFIIWYNAGVQDINSWTIEERIISGTARTLAIGNIDSSAENEIIAGINSASGNVDYLTVYKWQ